MQTANGNQTFNMDDPAWYLIAEYSLNDVMFGQEREFELSAGSLFQTMRDLSNSSECLKRIEVTITEAARGAKGYFNFSLPDVPVHICLFCHKKTMENTRDTEDHKNGGWGFYVIERGRESQNAPYQDRPRVVELYLYKEGE